MTSTDREAVTQLLHKLSSGNKEAFDELIPVVYAQLRKLASRCLQSERPEHTLRATALVHEAYVRLVDSEVPWQDRLHFYAVSARVMRHILVDHAKTNRRQKRGGGIDRVPLDEAVLVGPDTPPDLLDLDQSLQRLAAHDPRKAQIIELLFFGGLTYDETALVLKISTATVHRELKMAKAWLYRELAPQPG
jgi:RNA polymerase sigma factor (TIGR02999 family)